MIISASRRTDLPAYYPRWLVRRFQEGFVLVRHPFRPHAVSRIPLTADVVDGIVFWTKDPCPLLPYLSAFQRYPYYFQWTLTAYGGDIEPGLPDKEHLLSAFAALSEKIGPERCLWRYDPILLSPVYTACWHVEAFDALCRRLAGCAALCTVSLLDPYRHIEARLAARGVRPPSPAEAARIISAFTASARRYGISLRACCEPSLALPSSACIDAARLSALGGCPLAAKKDSAQRPLCGCSESVDIGAYATCPAGCLYCYARCGPVLPYRVDPASPILGTPVTAEDEITPRSVRSLRRPFSPSLFESPF